MAITRYLPELSKKEMLALLDESRVGRLGLNDEPQPYVVPTDFIYDDDAIYIHSPRDGKKSELARKNPHVCFEVDKYNEDVTEYKSIIIRGDIREISDDAERRKVIRSLSQKAARTGREYVHPFSSGLNAIHISIFKIVINDMTGVKSPAGGHP